MKQRQESELKLGALLSHPGGGKIWVGSAFMLCVRKVENSDSGEPDNLKVNLLGLGAVKRLAGL